MTGRRNTAGVVSLAGLVALAVIAGVAPSLGLRDPNAQPDGLVLRDLPPLSRVQAVRLRSGELRYAHEIQADEAGLRYRRGERWIQVASGELAPNPRAAALFWAGTDEYGRDLLSRLIHGGRISMLIALLAAATALGLGTAVGLTSGYLGGWTDALLMRLADVMLAVPRLFLALLLVALYGASLTTTVVVLGITGWMGAARLVRGEVLALREREFVQAAQASGAPALRIALRHVLPSALAPVLVLSALCVGDAILLEGALSFLGLGIPPPAPSWGNMVAEGRASLTHSWWIATLPGLAIAGTVIALSFAGDGLQSRPGRDPARGRTPDKPTTPDRPGRNERLLSDAETGERFEVATLRQSAAECAPRRC